MSKFLIDENLPVNVSVWKGTNFEFVSSEFQSESDSNLWDYARSRGSTGNRSHNDKMRLLILFILFCTFGCGRADNVAPPDKSIIGTWKLLGMTKQPFPLDKITETDMIGGRNGLQGRRYF